MRRETCPKCGQTGRESAIDPVKGNSLYVSRPAGLKRAQVVKRTREPTEEENQALPGVEPERAEKLKLGRRIE